MVIEKLVQQFCQTHSLPSSFEDTALSVYWPLAKSLHAEVLSSSKTRLVGIHGCQGSGKSTLTDFLLYVFEHHFSMPCQGLSIDDFYLTRQERKSLAASVHPLLKTRGVPGTHDMPLLKETLAQLNQSDFVPLSIPRFNKAMDDRADEKEWTQVTVRPKLVILEGWCVGTCAESGAALSTPVNSLEENEDPHGLWRTYANSKLVNEYEPVFDGLDSLVMLKAPGFHAVKAWRLEQEERLVAKLKKEGKAVDEAMSEQEVDRFIQHYERLTTHSLKVLPSIASVVLTLDESRNVQTAEYADTL